MKRTIAIAAVLLAGCGTTWTKPGATEADYRRDHYACERDAALLPPLAGIGMRERCMQAKGWRGA